MSHGRISQYKFVSSLPVALSLLNQAQWRQKHFGSEDLFTVCVEDARLWCTINHHVALNPPNKHTGRMLITLDSISWDYMKFKGFLNLCFYNDTLFFRRQLALQPQVRSVIPFQFLYKWDPKHSLTGFPSIPTGSGTLLKLPWKRKKWRHLSKCVSFSLCTTLDRCSYYSGFRYVEKNTAKPLLQEENKDLVLLPQAN